MKKIIFFTFILVTLLFACSDDPVFDTSFPNIEVNVSNIKSTSVEFDVRKTDYEYCKNYGLYYSIYSDFRTCTKTSGGTISGLSPSTTYYYKSFCVDSYDNNIYGTVKKFTTYAKPKASVTFVSLKQTDVDYYSSGYYYKGERYKYVFEITAKLRLTGYQYVNEVGFDEDGWRIYWSAPSRDGEYTTSWNYLTNNRKETLEVKAYAESKADDDVYQYKKITLQY